MSQYYHDYVWKEGVPYGIGAVEASAPIAYKIPMDPYRKRIAIEKYIFGAFDGILYDSAFLDFRHLKPAEQTAWQKIIVADGEQQTIAAIYNQDDRLILFETYSFENKLCRSCHTTSGHGITVCHQKMFYTVLGDAFNGVILSDKNEHAVMFKRYTLEEGTEQYHELLEESWDGGKIPIVTSPFTAH